MGTVKAPGRGKGSLIDLCGRKGKMATCRVGLPARRHPESASGGRGISRPRVPRGRRSGASAPHMGAARLARTRDFQTRIARPVEIPRRIRRTANAPRNDKVQATRRQHVLASGEEKKRWRGAESAGFPVLSPVGRSILNAKLNKGSYYVGHSSVCMSPCRSYR
jgi:hypothetical protein